MEDGFEGWGGGWQSDQLGGVGVITWTREEREGGGCSKAFMRLGQQDQGKQVSRMAPSIWGVMGPSLPEMGDAGQGDGFGGANQESVWDIRVSSSRTDTSIIHLEFPGIRPSRGPRTVGGVNDGTDAVMPADLLLSVERPEHQRCSLDDREKPCYVLSHPAGYLPK